MSATQSTILSADQLSPGFSVDPYLAGQLVSEMVGGIQSEGVITSTKHFIGNEQETQRQASRSTPKVEATSSNIDDKTMKAVVFQRPV